MYTKKRLLDGTGSQGILAIILGFSVLSVAYSLTATPSPGDRQAARPYAAKYLCTVRLLVPIAWAISETFSPLAFSSLARSGSPFVVPFFLPLKSPFPLAMSMPIRRRCAIRTMSLP